MGLEALALGRPYINGIYVFIGGFGKQ